MTTNGIVTARLSAYNMVDPKAIVRKPGHNPRFDFGEIAELAKSIKFQATDCKVPGGLLNAILIKRTGPATFELVDGDRRLTAVELLIKMAAEGKPDGYDFPEGIPARLADKALDEVTGLIQMFEANTGKPFLPLEEAAAYKKMQDAGMSIEQIGKAVQRAHVHIVATLALLTAAPELKDAVKSGKVGGTVAKKIATAARGDLKKQAELVNDAIAAGKDAKKKRVVVQKIEQARADKAAKKGKTLKIRALTDDQLSDLGARVSKHIQALMKEAKLEADADLFAWVKADDKLAVAYTLGALNALKVAAGDKKISLEV